MKQTIKKRVYLVKLPYPQDKKVRLVKCAREQPYFILKDLMKIFDMNKKTALEICYPHLEMVGHTHVCSLYGYWRMVLFGKSKRNRIFQHAFTKQAVSSLYKDNIKRYLDVVQNDKKKTKSSIKEFK